jgi:filamentous hemagglutinin family protein
VGGDVSISPPGTTTTINQTSSRAIINWRSFNVGTNESVVITQKTNRDILLNRVQGTGPTNIDGTLRANGRVFIVNPRGVVFGSTAQVNVADLVATTADTLNSTFMDGNPAFRTVSPLGMQVVNRGKITVDPGGSVLLLAPSVANTGTISARNGNVVLATGRAFFIDLFGDGLVQVATAAVSGPPSGPITQVGTLQVGSGNVLVRHAFGAATLSGTLNGVPFSDLATQAVTLPGGAIAFVGTSTPPGALLDTTWIKPGIPGGGGGVIDASPIYSLSVPTASAGQNAPALDPPPSVTQSARLAEFNRLGDPEGAFSRRTESTGSDLPAGVLYTVGEPARSPLAQAVGFTQSQPATGAAPAPKADSGKRPCTVAQLLSAQGCR